MNGPQAIRVTLTAGHSMNCRRNRDEVRTVIPCEDIGGRGKQKHAVER